MSASMNGLHTLPLDLLEAQISTLDLLLAMFPGENEFEVSPADLDLITALRENECDDTSSIPVEIPLAIHVSLDPTHAIQVNVTVPLRSSDLEPLEPPPFIFHLRQPTWLGRADMAELSAKLPDDIFSALEFLQDSGVSLIPSVEPNNTNEKITEAGPLVRVWFYFPSLSTREKRSHMVNWAPSYSLTGFVLAGKPGMLCLEGTAISIDAYMNEIKTVSWGDIPSHQKKVSERYREMIEKRAFENMQEITDKVGERHGARQNRGDMAAIEGWLKDKGLDDAFENVILQSKDVR